MDDLIAQIVNALQTRSTIPQFPTSLTVAKAYELQHQVVASFAQDSIVGLKAGLTSAASQESFGITHPVLGRIFKSGQLFSGVSFSTVSGGLLECEIGVCVDAAGTPTAFGPVIELPRFPFKLPTRTTGPNLIACNVAADRFIVGEFLELPTSFDECSVTLSLDGETVCKATLTEPLGGPLHSLAWMLSEANLRGISIPDDALMLTGACGGIHPALPGLYIADYGSLGRIEFEIRAE